MKYVCLLNIIVVLEELRNRLQFESIFKSFFLDKIEITTNFSKTFKTPIFFVIFISGVNKKPPEIKFRTDFYDSI